MSVVIVIFHKKHLKAQYVTSEPAVQSSTDVSSTPEPNRPDQGLKLVETGNEAV